MENIRKGVDIKHVTSCKQASKFIIKPNFESSTIFSENLVGIHMGRTELLLNKPIYLGMSILDISTLVYDFLYNYIKKKYETKAKLLFTDRDSLCYEIETKYFYKDISPDVERLFDTSDFPNNHPSGILVGKNKKVTWHVQR